MMLDSKPRDEGSIPSTPANTNIMKILAKDIQRGDLIEQIGLIHSILNVSKDTIQFMIIPIHLEYYGLEQTSEISLDSEYTLVEGEGKVEYIDYCLRKSSHALDDFIKALNYYLTWKESDRKSKHAYKSRKMKNLTEGDLTKHGLVCGKVDSWLHGDSLKMKFLSHKTYKVFTFCYIVQLLHEKMEKGTFDDRVKVLNHDESKVDDFITKCDASIQETMQDIIKTKSFLFRMKCQNITQE